MAGILIGRRKNFSLETFGIYKRRNIKRLRIN